MATLTYADVVNEPCYKDVVAGGDPALIHMLHQLRENIKVHIYNLQQRNEYYEKSRHLGFEFLKHIIMLDYEITKWEETLSASASTSTPAPAAAATPAYAHAPTHTSTPGYTYYPPYYNAPQAPPVTYTTLDDVESQHDNDGQIDDDEVNRLMTDSYETFVSKYCSEC